MKFKFKGLLRDKTAAGTIRWRVRVEGDRNKKIRISMGPGEPGFHEYYHAARAGQKPIVERAEQSKKGTLDELCKKHLEWLERQVAAGTMSSKTHQSRRTGLKQACETLDPDGDRMGSLNCDLPEEAFVHIQDAFGIRTAAADTCIKALRAAYRWGAKRGFPKNSPVFEVERVHLEGGGAKPWRAEDVENFLATHGPGTMARLWFCLAYDSHGRIGDMHLLGSKNLVQYDGERYLNGSPLSVARRSYLYHLVKCSPRNLSCTRIVPSSWQPSTANPSHRPVRSATVCGNGS